MSHTTLEQNHPPQEGFPTKARQLTCTEYAAGTDRVGLQLTLSGDHRDFHQYVLLDTERARELQAQLDQTFGPPPR